MKIRARHLRAASAALAALALLAAAYTPVAAGVLSIGSSWGPIWGLLWRSALLALCTGFAASALGTLMAMILWEGTSRRMRGAIQAVIYATAGIPSVAIALIVLLALPGAPSLAKVSVALVLSIAPYATRYVLDDLNKMPAYTVDALRALGAGEARTIFGGLLPYARSSLFPTALYTCSRAMTEVSILSLLCHPDDRFLTFRVAVEPLSSATFPAVLLLCAGAMLLFDRARSLYKRR